MPHPLLCQQLVSGTDAHSGLACNGTIVNDTEMGEVIQLQGDQRKDVQEFLVDKKEGLELDAKTIKVRIIPFRQMLTTANSLSGPRFLDLTSHGSPSRLAQRTDRSCLGQALFPSFLPYLT